VPALEAEMHPGGLPPEFFEFIAKWGYLAYGVGVALGVPVTEDLWLPIGGYLAWAGAFSLPGALVVAILGTLAIDNAGYWAGRLGGRPLLERLAQYIPGMAAGLRRAERFFSSHGDSAVFLARFIAWLRFGVGPLAGLSRMRYPRFVLYNLAAALIWVTTMVTVGYLGGPYLDRVLVRLWQAQGITVAVVLLLWLGWRFTARWWDRRRGGRRV
jgi:membrane protein DedA with SNARE-associated domain